MEKQASCELVALSDVKTGMVRIAVAYTGKFERDAKAFAITARDLEDMRRNLRGREVPIDYEHLSGAVAPPGWSKAAGWIRKPAGIEPFSHRANGDRVNSDNRSITQSQILWAWAELTPAALAMVKQKEYRYFSPEIHWAETDEHGKPMGTRLAAGALTNRPFLKDLPPIEISDADYQSLFGLAAREDGRLAAIALSEAGRLIDVDQAHVNKSISQISVGYKQPVAVGADGKKDGESGAGRQRSKETGNRPPTSDNRQPKENSMAKKFSLRKMKDGPHQGRFGLFQDEDLVSLDDEAVTFDDAELRKLFEDADLEEADLEEDGALSARGGKKLKEIAALCESFKDGKVSLHEAARLVDQGALSPGSIFHAQEAERVVEAAIKAGKVLPKKRGLAFRMALRDSKAFKALIEDARPIVDFRTYGHAAGHEGVGTAQEELDLEVKRFMTEHKVGYSEALSEITKQNPELWRHASHEIEEQSGRQRVTEEE